MQPAPPEQFVLDRFGLTGNALRARARHRARAPRRLGRLLLRVRRVQTASLEDGVVKKATRNVRQGVGVRVLAGARSGYAYSDEVTLERLELAARTARLHRRPRHRRERRSRARAPATRRARPLPASRRRRSRRRSPIRSRCSSASTRLARAVDPGDHQRHGRARPGASRRADRHGRDGPAGRRRAAAACASEHHAASPSAAAAHAGHGTAAAAATRSRCSLDGRAERFAREAARQALVNLDAVAAPGGHHDRRARSRAGPASCCTRRSATASRATSTARAPRPSPTASARASRRELCTVVDDGTHARAAAARSTSTTRARRRGRTVLIENGILRGYLQDRLNARLMGMPLTGNGRRESFAHLPMPRMTNTFMLAGEDDPEDILRSVDRGLYAVSFGGGQVDITSGKFVFSASEAYLIEGGQRRRAGEGRDADRQRPRRADPHHARRQRPGARRGHRHLRQGRPVGAGRRRPADRPHRRPHRRRDAGRERARRPARRRRSGWSRRASPRARAPPTRSSARATGSRSASASARSRS